MSLHDALVRALQGEVLTAAQMRGAIAELMSGQAEPLQAAALLASLATRGESTQEVTGAAQAMLEASATFPAPGCREAIDTCGTGGDGAGTFNISTAASFVVAACGAPVCKHGNRAVSSKSGSADLLEALGARIDLPPEAMARVFARTGQAFLFAPTYHPAVRHVMPVRRGLAVRTLFNLLGPVINPARVHYQVMGVFDGKWLDLIEVLRNLGARRAMIIHGEEGLDEFSLSGPTLVAELSAEGDIKRYRVTPQELGLEPCTLEELRGGEAQENAATLRRLFASRGTEPIARAIACNAGAALYTMGRAGSIAEGVTQATAAIASGQAAAAMEGFVAATQQEAP